MARILWLSDAPSRASGFALVTREVCKRLAAVGHDIVILSWWCNAPTTYCGMEVRPCPIEPRAAASVIIRCVRTIRPDFLLTLADVPWVSYIASQPVQRALWWSNTRWCLYYPVDGTLADGTLPHKWLVVLSKVDLPVTMSAFGRAASARSGIDASLIPHGCDVELFRPPACKADAKRRLGYEGRFVILSDIRNHRRKLIPRALDVVGKLNVPRERLVFHLHTCMEPQEDAESYRYDVRTDVELLELGIVSGVRKGATDLSMSDLANVYAAADVHLLASFGEGFGLPTLQAASAGVVPVVPANSASTELVGAHGFAVPCDSWTVDEFGLLRGFMDRGCAAAVLERLYEDSNLLRARSLAARRFALELTWDRVAARWDDCLRERGSTGRSVSDRKRITFVESGRIVPRRRSKTLRPSGHDASFLPIPRIVVPTRLGGAKQLRRCPGSIIVADPSCVRCLVVLERLFPGTRVLDFTSVAVRGSISDPLIEEAVLVVDPNGRWRPIDEICAAKGVNFLGDSRLWSKIVEASLLAQARLLLTDYPFAEQRLAAARRRLGFELRA